MWVHQRELGSKPSASIIAKLIFLYYERLEIWLHLGQSFHTKAGPLPRRPLHCGRKLVVFDLQSLRNSAHTVLLFSQFCNPRDVVKSLLRPCEGGSNHFPQGYKSHHQNSAVILGFDIVEISAIRAHERQICHVHLWFPSANMLRKYNEEVFIIDRHASSVLACNCMKRF